MGSAMQSVTGNWAMAGQYKTDAAIQRANARVARAQGKAQKGNAYGQALRIEQENKVAGEQASDAMARLRGAESKAVGSIQAARGASGFNAEGSGMTAQVSAMSQFEQQAQDMAYSRSLQDQSARFSAAMSEKSGDFAEMGANAEGAYMDASANIYNMMARNANRAGNLTGLMSLAFGEYGTALASMANSTRPGTFESQYGMGARNQDVFGAGTTQLFDYMKSWLV